MIDREKVIRDLEYLVSFGGASQQSMVMEIAMESLELLKEQEAVKPTSDAFGQHYCSRCNALLHPSWACCPYCRQEVKWE